MRDHEIKDMVQSLVNAGLVEKDREVEAAGVIGSCWRNKVALVYSVEDVMGAVPKISRKDAVKIIHKMLELDEAVRFEGSEWFYIAREWADEDDHSRQSAQADGEHSGRDERPRADS
jgi:hypothetical protein